MADVKKPAKTGNEALKSAVKPVRSRRTSESEEVGFVVRREHRRQHRQDRAL